MKYGDAKGELWNLLRINASKEILTKHQEAAIQKAQIAMELLENFERDMRDYILATYKGDFDDVEDAKSYLSEPDWYEGMDDEEIIASANYLQIEYYDGEADFDEVLNMYNSLMSE